MGSLLHPVGPQSAAVYWVRRGAVLAVTALVLVGFWSLFQPQQSAPAAGGVVIAAASPSVSQSSTMPTAAASTTPTGSPSPTAAAACDATNTDLALSGYQQVKTNAKQTSFKLGITNTGKSTCVLNLSAASFALKVVSGTDRIWTTEDCAKWVPAKKTKLGAGKKYEFPIDWTVRRSSASCKLAKQTLGAGTYQAVATFASDDTAKTVFQLVAAA